MLGLACFLLRSSYYSTDNLRIFFSFALRIDGDEKRKEIESWGKMKDNGVRAKKKIDVFLFLY